MSFRELRNFCEIMRGLGYPRLISIENFRNPNFELVADILYWLAQRFDPTADISDDIEEERHRVEFIKQIATLFKTKTRIKLNLKKLYGSDGYAVQEILKVATILYKAYNSTPSDEDSSQGFQLPAKLANLKAHKQVATEITEIGAKLYDSLGKEKDLKIHREKALAFLDNISTNLENTQDQQYIEKCVRDIIAQQDENIDEMQKYVTNLEKDQRTLTEKIRRRTMELEKSQKRLQLMTGMRPAYLDEYERLEIELQKYYDVYIEKFRNLNYLENQLEEYLKIEKRQLEQTMQQQANRQKEQNEKELRELEGNDDIDQSRLDQQIQMAEMEMQQRGQSRGDSRALGSRQNKRQPMGNVGEESDEDDSEGEDSGEEGSGQDLEDSNESVDNF
ncbi:hypothetical protein PPERSA_00332 [Pseudocohnilembus persalinus]|uniref:Clusterin-associated protein-1 n=1 Tax=Pseudocohnilembus persalinus TaxID=266149 RepID=A0A0V0QHC4_PSEPJ|nr:hypothetical protein PPERSA_00332 [Pseudocohnilembus persalinus]|eukprot:KRX01625.1 hypothetical protein PPERSA_00332 [Pseudocohnilembus persalinus]